MARRRWLPIMVLLLAGLAVALAIRRPDRMLDQFFAPDAPANRLDIIRGVAIPKSEGGTR